MQVHKSIFFIIGGIFLFTLAAPLLSQQLEVGGNIDVKNNRVTNLANPVALADAVNKSYVQVRVSITGDSLFLGPDQFVINPEISAANLPFAILDILQNTIYIEGEYSIYKTFDYSFLTNDGKLAYDAVSGEVRIKTQKHYSRLADLMDAETNVSAS